VGFFDIKKQASPKISKNILGVGGICRMWLVVNFLPRTTKQVKKRKKDFTGVC